LPSTPNRRPTSLRTSRVIGKTPPILEACRSPAVTVPFPVPGQRSEVTE
jgi:hypothetical protein